MDQTATTHFSRHVIAKACFVAGVFVVLGLTGCIDEPFVTLPPDTNAMWMRSVQIDASQCLQRDGTYKLCSASAAKDMQRVRHMSGVIGAPLTAVELDPGTKLADQSFRELTALWARVPVGYGCEATMQGVFPDRTADVSNLTNFKFARLSELIKAVRDANAVPIWTAAYGLGTGDGACTYGQHGLEQDGKPLAEQSGTSIGNSDNSDNSDKEIKDWAKAVRRVVEYYDLELPKLKAGDEACNPQPGIKKSWNCSASLFNIEFGRDPNGAGGFTNETKANWLKAYKEFAKAIRERFPYPANTINLLGPSVVIHGKAEVEITSGASRSWIFDFIDYVVNENLKLSFLTFEVVAATPVEAADIAKAVRAYADSKGLKDEDGRPIRLFVTDLRIKEAKLPASLIASRSRRSTYYGAFYAATKALWQSTVYGATVGRSARALTLDPAASTPDQVSKASQDSDLIWFGTSDPAPGSLKPAAWQSFWFYDGFLGGGGGALDTCLPGKTCADVAAEARAKSMILVGQGPDALGVSGTQKSDPVAGLITIATREKCVSGDADTLGAPRDCLTGQDAERFPAVAKGRKNVVRVFVADLNWSVTERETLRHDLRLQIDGLPKDTETVGYRWASIDGDDLTWDQHNFPEQGVLDVEDGAFHVRRTIAVPSMHYFEFLY